MMKVDVASERTEENDPAMDDMGDSVAEKIRLDMFALSTL